MAQTLKFGNGTWATKKGSTLAFNDEDGNYKPLPFATTRATGATRVNKQGLIEVVESDRPRIDYTDSADGVLLLEKAATNSITYSEAFDNAYWTKTISTITSNSIISPDGTLNADKLIPSASNNIHKIGRDLGSVNGDYTFSIFAKKGEYKNILLWDDNLSEGIGVNLDDLSVFRNVGNEGYNIENYGNGWVRISLTLDYSAQAIRFSVYVYDNSNQITFLGNGTDGLYIYGAQVESGNIASSYIPTQGSAVTRVAETASGSGNSEVFNDSEGVLFVDIAANANDGVAKRISINNATDENVIQIYYSSTANRIVGRVAVGDITQASLVYDLTAVTDFNKIAIKYKTNDFALWVNGFEIGTDTSGSTFSNGTLTELAFDRGNGAEDFYGKTKEIGYYNTILTDAELETLTSYRSLSELVTELNLNTL